MSEQLAEYQQRVRAFEAEWAGADKLVKGHLTASEEMARELQSSREGSQRLEAALTEAQGALQRAGVREEQLQAEIRQLSSRMEQQAEMLSRQARTARSTAYESAQAAASQATSPRHAIHRSKPAILLLIQLSLCLASHHFISESVHHVWLFDSPAIHPPVISSVSPFINAIHPPLHPSIAAGRGERCGCT